MGGWGHVSGRVEDGRSEGVRVGAWGMRVGGLRMGGVRV